jgi:eukaryotic-like serine/threonine-protein kinase
LAYEPLGRYGQAERLLREVVAHRRRANEPGGQQLAGDLVLLGHNLLDQGKCADAEVALRECLEILKTASPDELSRCEAQSLFGAALAGQTRYTEAEPALVSGYEGMKAGEPRIPIPDRASLRAAGERVVCLYEAWNKPDQSAEWKAKLNMRDLPTDVFGP